MSLFNYKDLAFEEHQGEKFHVLSARFLDYNHQFREITLTWTMVGRQSMWLAEFSGLTTEYNGDLATVLEKAYKHYQEKRYMPKEAAK